MCIFLPWYQAIGFSFFIVLVIVLHIFPRVWVYLSVFLFPMIGMKYPNVYLNMRGFDRSDAIPLMLLLAVIPFPFLIINVLTKPSRDIIKNPIFLPVFLLVSYSISTLFWSPAGMGFKLLYLFHLIIDIILFYYLFYFIDDVKLHRRLMWCMVFSGLVISVQTMVEFGYVVQNLAFIQEDLIIKALNVFSIQVLSQSNLNELNASGFFLGPQISSIMLDIVVFTAVGLLLTENNKARRWFLRIAILMCITAVFLTGNKAGSWSLVMVLFLFVIFSIKLRKNMIRNLLATLAIFVSIFLTMALVIRSQGSKDPRIVNVSTAQQSSIGKRIYFWKTGFMELDKKRLTLFGLGVGGYKYFTRAYMIPHAHNIYLSLFFDFGVMGLIVCCIIMFILLKLFLKVLSRQETYLQNMSLAYGISLVLIALTGLVYTTYYMDFVWFVLGLAVATFRLAGKELPVENNL